MSKINDTYLETLEELFVDYDYKVSPRGMEIFEILNHSFMLDMDNPIISIPERKLNYNFMFGEAAWMLDGRNDVKTIEKYMKGITRFSDDGITFFGAYGPKIITQTSYVVNTLCNDQDSRQAVLSIWRENPKSSADIPCTLTMQFFLREGLLYCNTNMRSNDIWLGTPYDAFNF
jgi:thymidylate synthase